MLEAEALEKGDDASIRPTVLNVTHLQLSNNRFFTTEGHDALGVAVLQLLGLIRLGARTTEDFWTYLDASGGQTGILLANGGLSQLQHVTIDEYMPYWLAQLVAKVPGLTELHTVACGKAGLASLPVLMMLLERLPQSLATLDVAEVSLIDGYVDHLRSLFTLAGSSLSDLKLLRLPYLDGGLGARGVKLVAAAAEERGVRVEWVR